MFMMHTFIVLILSQRLWMASAFAKMPTFNRGHLSHKRSCLFSSDEMPDATLGLMQLASAHFTPQVLRCLVELGIPDIIGNENMTIDDISKRLSVNNDDSDDDHNRRIEKDALLSVMRLSAAVGITVEELTQQNHTRSDERTYRFGLTSMGALLQTTQVPGQLSLASCVQHWTETPLWNSWLHLPDYIVGEGGRDLPFDRANGMSSDQYYGHDKSSLHIANDFVRTISDGEISAIVEGFDWMTLSGKTLIDIGGHNGKVMGGVIKKFPGIECICLDLPEVIASAADPPPGVRLVCGNVMDPTSIPK